MDLPLIRKKMPTKLNTKLWGIFFTGARFPSVRKSSKHGSRVCHCVTKAYSLWRARRLKARAKKVFRPGKVNYRHECCKNWTIQMMWPICVFKTFTCTRSQETNIIQLVAAIPKSPISSIRNYSASAWWTIDVLEPESVRAYEFTPGFIELYAFK